MLSASAGASSSRNRGSLCVSAGLEAGFVAEVAQRGCRNHGVLLWLVATSLSSFLLVPSIPLRECEARLRREEMVLVPVGLACTSLVAKRTTYCRRLPLRESRARQALQWIRFLHHLPNHHPSLRPSPPEQFSLPVSSSRSREAYIGRLAVRPSFRLVA